MYLSESPFDRDELTVRAGCYVAAGQHAGKRALAAATAVGTSHADSRAWAEVAGTRL
jgi:hypothetical protein